MLDHGGTLYRSPAPGSERIDRLITGQLLAGGRINGDHLDAVPKRTEKHPDIAVEIHVTSRIDRVVIVRGYGLEDQALVRPLVIRSSRVQGGIGGHADHRVVGSEGGTGVIDPISPIAIPGVGCPDVRDG